MMYVLQNELDKGKVNLTEVEGMLKLIDREYSRLEEKNGSVYLIRRLGIGICVAAFEEKIVIDDGSKITGEINIKNTIDAVKFKLAL